MSTPTSSNPLPEGEGGTQRSWEGEGLGCQPGNPSSSHACGAGPSFSLWEKGLSLGGATT
jgi:hypothetical protein